MDELAPYYARELATLHANSARLAGRYPRLAASLRLAPDGSGDPQIDQLLHSVALLSARTSMRLDDGYAGFAEKLLEAIYPGYRRPLPPCAVARLKRGMLNGELACGDTVLAAGSGLPVSFKSLAAVDTRAPDIVQARFRSAGSFRTSEGSFYTGPYIELVWQGAWPATHRLFVDGDQPTAAALRDALGLGVKAILRTHFLHENLVVAGGYLRTCGFSEDECVLREPVASHPAFRLLREYFAFPSKFSFFELALPARGIDEDNEAEIGGGVIAGEPTGGAAGEPRNQRAMIMLDPAMLGRNRALEDIAAQNFLTRCVPVANLFTSLSSVSNGAHVATAACIVPESDGPEKHELIAIESVVIERAGTHKAIVDVPHLFAIRRDGAGTDGPFWVDGGEDDAGTKSILFIDRRNAPAALSAPASVQMLCCDGDRPAQIVCGTQMATIFSSGEGDGAVGELVTRPSSMARFRSGKDVVWRLVSQLSLSQTSLLEPTCGVLKEMLRMHVPAGADWCEQMIGALSEIRQKPITRWLPGSFPPMLVRGTEIDLQIDDIQMEALGMNAFVQVLDAFFAQYAQMNSFTQLIITSSHTGKEIHRCAMRTGNGPLI